MLRENASEGNWKTKGIVSAMNHKELIIFI